MYVRAIHISRWLIISSVKRCRISHLEKSNLQSFDCMFYHHHSTRIAVLHATYYINNIRCVHKILLILIIITFYVYRRCVLYFLLLLLLLLLCYRWLQRGSMFVISLSQFLKLLKVDDKWHKQTLLDLGAGDGEVTAHIASLFDQVYVTEVSHTMRNLLQKRGFK